MINHQSSCTPSVPAEQQPQCTSYVCSLSECWTWAEPLDYARKSYLEKQCFPQYSTATQQSNGQSWDAAYILARTMSTMSVNSVPLRFVSFWNHQRRKWFAPLPMKIWRPSCSTQDAYWRCSWRWTWPSGRPSIPRPNGYYTWFAMHLVFVIVTLRTVTTIDPIDDGKNFHIFEFVLGLAVKSYVETVSIEGQPGRINIRTDQGRSLLIDITKYYQLFRGGLVGRFVSYWTTKYHSCGCVLEYCVVLRSTQLTGTRSHVY